MKAPLIFEKFIRAVRTHQLLARGDRVVVAVSGGADSVALLSLFLEVQSQFDLDLVVAHLNHNLRGKSSDEDQEFVRKLANLHGKRFICEQIPLEAVATRNENLENWARERRYEFLSKAAEATGAQRVALGHTMSDQAETFLMRLLRGSGTVGLSGMSYRRNRFIRPLLSIERREILEYLKLRGLDWREDLSNMDTQFLRNRLRLEIIPTLEQRCNPKIVPLLATSADLLRESNEALQAWAVEIFVREAVVDGNRILWDVNSLVALPLGLQKRLVSLSLEKLIPGTHQLSAPKLTSIVDLLGEGRSGKFVQTKTFKCSRDFNRLLVEVLPFTSPKNFCYTLRIPGRVDLSHAGTCFEARFEPSVPKTVVLNRWELSLSRAELESGFFVRNWEPGDVYFPPDMSSPRRVAEMLARRKIPRQNRASWPVVVLAGRIVCVKDFPFSADNAIQTTKETRVVIEERCQDQ